MTGAPAVPPPEAAGPAAQRAAWPARAAMPLALAVLLLLFLQWPLRDLLGAGGTLANDWAQCLFALYVALAVPHAAKRGLHIVARPDVADSAVGRRGWRALGGALGVLAWSAFVGISAAPMVQRSLVGGEHFPETGHAGYFLIKVALMILAAGLAWQAAADGLRSWRQRLRRAQS